MKSDVNNINKIFDELPAYRTEEEIRVLYSKQLDEVKDRYKLVIQNRAQAKAPAAVVMDAVIKLCRDAKGDIVRLLEWGDDVISNLIPMPTTAVSYARSITNTQSKDCQRISIEKGSEGCSIIASIISKGDVADVEISMLGSDSSPLHPFTLEIKDSENGAVLLDKRDFSAGAASIKGMTKGIYSIESTSNDKKASLILKIEA